MSESILVTIKKLLGIDDSYRAFDADIIVFINAAFMTLMQLGVGPKNGFAVHDYDTQWKHFLTNEVNLNTVQEYVYLKVKLIFDPPQNSPVLEAYKQRISEIENRLIMQAESVEDFSFIDTADNPRL